MGGGSGSDCKESIQTYRNGKIGTKGRKWMVVWITRAMRALALPTTGSMIPTAGGTTRTSPASRVLDTPLLECLC